MPDDPTTQGDAPRDRDARVRQLEEFWSAHEAHVAAREAAAPYLSSPEWDTFSACIGPAAERLRRARAELLASAPLEETAPASNVPRLVVVTDPARNSGRPSVEGACIRVDVLLGRLRAGERVDDLRDDYDAIPAEAWPVLSALAGEASLPHPLAADLRGWLDDTQRIGPGDMQAHKLLARASAVLAGEADPGEAVPPEPQRQPPHKEESPAGLLLRVACDLADYAPWRQSPDMDMLKSTVQRYREAYGVKAGGAPQAASAPQS